MQILQVRKASLEKTYAQLEVEKNATVPRKIKKKHEDKKKHGIKYYSFQHFLSVDQSIINAPQEL